MLTVPQKENVDNGEDDEKGELPIMDMSTKTFAQYRSIINTLIYSYVMMNLDSHGRDGAMGDNTIIYSYVTMKLDSHGKVGAIGDA